MRLLNVETQQIEDVPDDVAGQALQSGTHLGDAKLQVPVVDSDGALSYVQGNNLGNSLGKGFSLAQPNDINRNFSGLERQAKAEVYDQSRAPGAALGFVDGASFGGSTALVKGLSLAEQALNIKNGPGSTAVEEIRNQKEFNPLTYIAGNLAGAVVSPVGKKVAAIGESVAALGAVSNIYKESGIIRGIVNQAVQGAAFGLGSGVSEASLGKPEDIAQHLIAGVGQGAVLGGAIGAGFETLGIIKQPLFDFAATKVGQIKDLVQRVARGTARTTMLDSITAKGLEDLNPAARTLVNEPAFRNEAFNKGGVKKFDAVVKETDDAIKQIGTDANETRRQLNEHIKDLPKDAKDDVNLLLQQNRGDLSQAMSSTFSDYKNIKSSYDQALIGSTEPAQIAGRLVGDTEGLIAKLKDMTGDPAAMERGNLLQEILDSKMPPVLSGTNDAVDIMKTGFTAGEEILLANRLRQYIPVKATNLGKYSADARAAMIEFRTGIDDYALKNHPIAEYAAQQQVVDQYYSAYKNMESFVMKGKGSNKAVMETPGLMKTIQMPERAEAFNAVLSNLQDFSPALDKVVAGRNDIKLALDGINDFQKVARQKAIDFGPQSFTSTDIKELANMLGSSAKLDAGIAKLGGSEALQQALSATPNPVEKLLLIKKASGQTITPELEALSKNADNYSKLSELMERQKSSSQDHVGELLKRITGGGVGATVGGMVAGPTGAKIGGLIGTVVTKSIEGIDPLSTLKLLTSIEQASNKAAQMTNKTIKLAVNGLTSDTTKKLVTVGVVESKPLSQSRKDFKKQSDYLNSFADPDQTKRILESKIGTIQQAPQIEKALKDQMAAQGKYLLSQVPKDPLAGNNIFPGNSKWQPSDMDLARFSRQVEAASNPLNVVAKVANGSVTPEEITTLQTLYPTIYKQLQSQVSSAIIERGDDISYSQKLKISQLFNVPTDPSLAPQAVANLQSNFGADKPSKPDSPGDTSNKKVTSIKINTQDYQTSTQRVTSK